jgi:hypothetical protein
MSHGYVDWVEWFMLLVMVAVPVALVLTGLLIDSTHKKRRHA